MHHTSDRIVEIGRWMHHSGWAPATDGNISHRMSKDSILITRTGISKGRMTRDDILQTDLDGSGADENVISSEFRLHCAVYRERPDVQAVIHAHPPFTVACSLAGIDLTAPYLPETLIGLGMIGMVPFAPPSSRAGAELAAKFIREHDVLVLFRHGTLTVGVSLEEAFYKLERLEFTAKVVWSASQISRLSPLTDAQIRQIRDAYLTLQ